MLEQCLEWRDLGLSRRHSKWGFDYPAVDLGSLFLEHNNGQVKAIIAYKNEHEEKQYASYPMYQAIINLGDKATIPVIACRYNDDYSKYKATPLNVYARNYLHETKELNEADFVRLLYEIKGQDLSKEFLLNMNVSV